ncbi:MAG: M23 family metallopeptidase [Rhodospirillaceae bacterium]
MNTAGGTCSGAPEARQNGGAALRRAAVLFIALMLAGCGADSYIVPWEVSAPTARQMMGPPPASVIVQRGDTVYGISRQYGVPMKDIIEANQLSPPYALLIGQMLVMPRPRSHVVRRGDTLSAIARVYDVDMNATARINRLAPPYLIQVGQYILLPDHAVEQRRPPASGAAAVAAAATPRPESKPTAEQGAAAPPQQSRPAATQGVPKPIPAADPARTAPPPARAASTFAWPVSGTVISRFGGKADGSRNDGINIAARRGTPVKAAENGVVVYAGNELKGFGNLLLVKHAGDWMTAYAHTELLTVKKGDTVKRGQVVGRIGSSGNVATPQLHFEIRKGSKAVDPLQYLGKQMAGL